MKPILIIKTGTTIKSLKEKHGDFDDWIINGTGMSRNSFIVSPVFEKVPLPQPDYISGIIISGAHANVTEFPQWIETTSQWLIKAADKNLPMLGICFGHQLIAHCFGGKVGFNPAGLEVGSAPINLTESAINDPLFSILPEKFFIQTSHSQTVLQLPPQAILLAYNDKDKYHAYRIGNNIWGVQFHPEFNCEVTRAYITHHKHDLASDNQHPEALVSVCRDSKEGPLLLKQFVKIVENS